MNIGITFFYGKQGEPEERTKLIAKHGFNSILTIDQPELDKQNGAFKKQIKLFQKYQLKPSSLHMEYRSEELPYFWKKGKIGDKIEKTLKKDVKLAKKYNFTCVVVHLEGEYSEIGITRIKNVLKTCKKYNLPLAIENLDNKELFFKVFETIEDDYMMMCYDSGHQHAFNPDIEYLELFKDKIITLHLHDNMGEQDEHTLNRFGNTDWEKVAKQLANCPNIKSLDYELLLKSSGTEQMTHDEVLEECMKQANELKANILKYQEK